MAVSIQAGKPRIDFSRYELTVDGRRVRLERQPMELLIFLIQRSGHLVTRAEIVHKLWGKNVVVDVDASINNAVGKIRAALRDDPERPRYLETVVGKGYRFVGEIEVAGATPAKVEPPDAGLRKPLALPRWTVWAALLVLVAGAAGTVVLRHRAHLRWARESVVSVEALARSQRYFEAFDLARTIQRYLPNEPTIARLLPDISDPLLVSTDPPGARVYLRRFSRDAAGNFPPRQFIGQTPISNLPVARGDYLMYIEKEGYAMFEGTISSSLIHAVSPLGGHPVIPVEQKLIETAKAPARMVFVPGGSYKLVSYGRPTQAVAKLSDYFIDKFEVTNREYKEFVSAGGYLKKEYWKPPFVKDDRTLTWEEAMREFKDHSGLPGPRSWTNQNYPEGKAEYPVTDISWYEAAAYAAFRGKRLPTVFQWEKAARIALPAKFGSTMPWGHKSDQTTEWRANFASHGPAPVQSFEFGASPYGAYNMAGNVAEWLLNPQSEGFTTAGGSWGDPPYIFGRYGAYPGFYSSDKLGFRCALNSANAPGDQGAMSFSPSDVATFSRTTQAELSGWLNYYRYDEAPLESSTVEVVETAEWRREKISYAGASDERAMAYLYLPKSAQKPFQVIHFMPGASAFDSLTVPQYVDMTVSPHIKSGRAVFVVVLQGYVERKWPPSHKPMEFSSVKYREQVINWVTDLSRGLDYLQTREDIDASKIAYYDISLEQLALVPAIEPRYRSVVFVGIGMPSLWLNAIPEANPINFAPHIRAPKLMLHGRYDEGDPLTSTAEPLYKLLSEPKRLEVFNGGHVPPFEVSVPIVNAWLDKTLGPVGHD